MYTTLTALAGFTDCLVTRRGIPCNMTLRALAAMIATCIFKAATLTGKRMYKRGRNILHKS